MWSAVMMCLFHELHDLVKFHMILPTWIGSILTLVIFHMISSFGLIPYWLWSNFIWFHPTDWFHIDFTLKAMVCRLLPDFHMYELLDQVLSKSSAFYLQQNISGICSTRWWRLTARQTILTWQPSWAGASALCKLDEQCHHQSSPNLSRFESLPQIAKYKKSPKFMSRQVTGMLMRWISDNQWKPKSTFFPQPYQQQDGKFWRRKVRRKEDVGRCQTDIQRDKLTDR